VLLHSVALLDYAADKVTLPLSKPMVTMPGLVTLSTREDSWVV